jgi:magnesium transporter
MIIAYTYNNEEELEKIELESGDTVPKNTVWLDLLEPSIEEEKYIEKALKMDIPTREELDKIEVMSPFYKEGESYYMTVTAIHKIEKDFPEGTAIIFILHPKCLITLRYSRPKAFTYFSNRASKNHSLCASPEIILEGIIESLVHSVADALEKTGNDIDSMLVDIFEMPEDFQDYDHKKRKLKRNISEEHSESTTNYYTYLIRRSGRAGNLISKIRESLVSINRMIIFFSQIEEAKLVSKKDLRVRFRNLAREIHSITEYANFLAQRNSFLLDATLGMINVEQNKVIKLFALATVVFLPPTLIATMYGMNFDYMPEIKWLYGYPFTLFSMVLSAVLPWIYFKKKGLV